MPFFGDGAVEKRILVALVAGSWSFRLTRHLAVRLAGHDEEDGRYQSMREHFSAHPNRFFLLFFIGQALIAWLFALPAWVVANDPDPGLSVWVILGVAVWLISLVGESIADRQLASFRNSSHNRARSARPGYGAIHGTRIISSSGCTGSAIR